MKRFCKHFRIASEPTPYDPGRARVWSAILSHTFVWFGIGWLFYDHPVGAAAVSLIGVRLSFFYRRQFIQKQKRIASSHFEQMLYSISSSLQAGRSVENAFRAAASDLQTMFAGNKPYLLRELEQLNRKVEHGASLESAVRQFAQRTDIPDIGTWADMFTACRRTGGDLVRMMRHSSRVIVERMNIERELAVGIAGKKLEAKALGFIPFVIVAMFRYGSPDYMAPLYEHSGRVIMTSALLLICAGMWVARIIMRIEA